MKTRFRKRYKIAPGIYINVGSKGITSVSIGAKGTTVNFSKRGTTATQSVPGTGISVSQTARRPDAPRVEQVPERQPSAARGYAIIAALIIAAIVIITTS